MGKQMSEKWVRTNLNNAAGSGSKGAMSLVDDLKLNGAPQQGFCLNGYLMYRTRAAGQHCILSRAVETN
jgi:hypothetical protein